MSGHGGTLVDVAAIVFGLFAIEWALGPGSGRRGSPATGGSREEWERGLFGVVTRERAPARETPLAAWSALDLTSAAAALSLLAGAIHLAVLPEHLAESLAFGAFFPLAGGFQIATGVKLKINPSGALSRRVAVVNASIVVLWVLSRTVGVPIGPEPWRREPVGALDITAAILEVALVVLVLRRQPIRARERPSV